MVSDEGRTQAEIGQALGVARNTISDWLRDVGSDSAHDQRRKLTEDDVALIVETSERRMTVEQRASVVMARRADEILARRCELYGRPLPRVS